MSHRHHDYLQKKISSLSEVSISSHTVYTLLTGTGGNGGIGLNLNMSSSIPNDTCTFAVI